MLFWYLGPSIIGVHEVFRSRGLDYRLIGLGSLLPLLVDLPIGHLGPGHSIVIVVVSLAVVMIGTVGRSRMLRRRLVCLPIGWLCGLVLSGAFLHDGCSSGRCSVPTPGESGCCRHRPCWCWARRPGSR